MPNHGLYDLLVDLFIALLLYLSNNSILTRTNAPPPWVNRGPRRPHGQAPPHNPLALSQLIGFYGKGWDAEFRVISVPFRG